MKPRPSADHAESMAERERVIERVTERVTAQILRDGVDPEHLTLDQAWGYFCFNPDWGKP